MEKNEQQMPRLGEPVPAFEAMTTKGKISFPCLLYTSDAADD